MLTEEEFIDYYKLRGRLPENMMSTGKRPLNDKELQTRYKKYIRIMEKKNTVKKDFYDVGDDYDVDEYEENIYEEKEVSKYMKNIFAVEAECIAENPNAEEFYNSIAHYDIEHGADYVAYFKKMNKMFGDLYDPAHIIPRSKSRELASCKLNIIILPRFVHSNIDGYREIFSVKHEAINKERQEELWKIIVGVERWNMLTEMTKRK